ncbi:MAG: hypothetical protein WC608_00445 [Parcubacteria group bacterium]
MEKQEISQAGKTFEKKSIEMKARAERFIDFSVDNLKKIVTIESDEEFNKELEEWSKYFKNARSEYLEGE